MERRSEKLPSGLELTVELRGTAATPEDAARAFEAARLALGAPSAGHGAEQARPLVGESPAMKELLRLLDRLRGSDVTVLITGENGVGKELVARRIHADSKRASGPFVALNVGALSDSLLESELFGHRKGAFTDAAYDKPGLFLAAHRGTFFLDEVGEMSPSLQVKLLRVLEDGAVTPVGGTTPIDVDVRVVAATNRDLAEQVKLGRFREDLYYRLNVVHVRVPSLRERSQDVPVLARHFLARLGAREKRTRTFTEGALERLSSRPWPGNVRELENEVERLWVLAGDRDVIDEAFVEEQSRKRPARTGADTPPPEGFRTLTEAVEALERRMVVGALEAARGNKTRAAEALGISRRNLIRKVQAFGLEAPGAEPGDDDA